MAAVKMGLYIALTNAGVPEETARKLAAAHTKLDVEATLVAMSPSEWITRSLSQAGASVRCPRSRSDATASVWRARWDR